MGVGIDFISPDMVSVDAHGMCEVGGVTDGMCVFCVFWLISMVIWCFYSYVINTK
jgi:hypothetical protein